MSRNIKKCQEFKYVCGIMHKIFTKHARDLKKAKCYNMVDDFPANDAVSFGEDVDWFRLKYIPTAGIQRELILDVDYAPMSWLFFPAMFNVAQDIMVNGIVITTDEERDNGAIASILTKIGERLGPDSVLKKLGLKDNEKICDAMFHGKLDKLVTDSDLIDDDDDDIDPCEAYVKEIDRYYNIIADRYADAISSSPTDVDAIIRNVKKVNIDDIITPHNNLTKNGAPHGLGAYDNGEGPCIIPMPYIIYSDDNDDEETTINVICGENKKWVDIMTISDDSPLYKWLTAKDVKSCDLHIGMIHNDRITIMHKKTMNEFRQCVQSLMTDGCLPAICLCCNVREGKYEVCYWMYDKEFKRCAENL